MAEDKRVTFWDSTDYVFIIDSWFYTDKGLYFSYLSERNIDEIAFLNILHRFDPIVAYIIVIEASWLYW